MVENISPSEAMTVPKIVAEMAKSNRSSCKKCKGKIEKDQLRLGIGQEFTAAADDLEPEQRAKYQMGMGTKFYHPACFGLAKKKNWYKEALPKMEISQFDGFGMLDAATQQEVRDLVKSAIEGGPTVTSPGGGGDEPGAKRRKVEVPLVQGSLTDPEFSKYKELHEEGSSMTNAALGAKLKINGQACSGNKGDLVDRYAMCKLLGCPPKCPIEDCRGTLRYDRTTKTPWSCSGYFDTDMGAFRRCNFKKMGIEAPARVPWKDDAFED